ncbi:gluconeogenesis factor YvcK family protein [Desulfolithobacter sp.]
MPRIEPHHILRQELQELTTQAVPVLDFLLHDNLAEKIIDLSLSGVPDFLASDLGRRLRQLVQTFSSVNTEDVKVVVFGGGTGLSNVIGGDSRRPVWRDHPFTGLKEVFPDLHSIVCVTDDGGSTGELLKDLPLVALGDIRHVLLSSIRRQCLQQRYNLDRLHAEEVARELHAIFNYRFISRPGSAAQLLEDTDARLDVLPTELRGLLTILTEQLFTDPRLCPSLKRPQCLGNLLLASSVFLRLDSSLSTTDLVAGHRIVRTAMIKGLGELAVNLGAGKNSVLPCTTTNARLQVQYANGVRVTSEDKSSRAQRGYPVDRVLVEFARQPFLPSEVLQQVREADIIIFAPGSLYTSIIPIMQVSGLPEAVRNNTRAMKLLVANIWVQKGETDVARDAPHRKFHVSDLIQAYHRNIPGGVTGLFSHVLALNLRDIPGSVLQSYALESKEPIYLDRFRLREMGFEVIEASIFSRELLNQRRVVQHDPDALARAVQTLWGLKISGYLPDHGRPLTLNGPTGLRPVIRKDYQVPCERYEQVRVVLQYLSTEQISQRSRFDEGMPATERQWLLERISEIIWNHPDILLEHLEYMRGISLVDRDCWHRSQKWDNVFSFYDPRDRRIKIRCDMTESLERFEMAFLLALGQSLLGNYAEKKEMEDVLLDGEKVGRIFRLTVREEHNLHCFFTRDELDTFLRLARMQPSARRPRCYSRLVNSDEGFTPPGLLFGLFYTWYLDNRFATHIEYKMSIMRNKISNLIPEQIRIVGRREGLIRFFRETVFRHPRQSVTSDQLQGATGTLLAGNPVHKERLAG